jgi:hypothetical protein
MYKSSLLIVIILLSLYTFNSVLLSHLISTGGQGEIEGAMPVFVKAVQSGFLRYDEILSIKQVDFFIERRLGGPSQTGCET